ncbi:hypothetical protein lerEdw1_006046 [Lerista edwardsae]|nr:hypothetical protein lerEdw1_006046 [Lerista edwardsae]
MALSIHVPHILFLNMTTDEQILRQTDGKIHQPPSLVVANGTTALLECQQNYNHDSMYWYQQQRNKPGLQLLYYSIQVTHEQRETNSDRFTAHRWNNTDFHLNISSASPEDSATYFCASSSHSSYWHLLQRTKIVLPAFLALQRGREEEGGDVSFTYHTSSLHIPLPPKKLNEKLVEEGK